ncbi:MAG: hypothetical protein LBC53_04270 [Spirochaetaceae bacterium]|jgi:hypothetical protein|nr:hypothetical protein [Spirochaetaceae bacterium]
MKKSIFFALLTLLTGFAYAQTTGTMRLAEGAASQIGTLLNKPALVKPAVATPLGKNWFRLETDAHIFTDQVTAKQVAAMLLDVPNQGKYLNGKKSKLTSTVVETKPEGVIADFVSISVAGPIQIKTPYRALLASSKTDSKIQLEVKQLPEDSEANKEIKNLYATRYAEDVAIDGKKYTYIRIYTIDDVNASILPGAKGTLEKNSEPVNEETLEMIIAAAKTK